jgi:hypothetical protein
MGEIRRIISPGGILLVFKINQEILLTSVGHLHHKLSLNRSKHLMALFMTYMTISFFPRLIASFLHRAGSGVVHIQLGAANVLRWWTVPISPLIISGSDVIDLVSSL